jgi:hypothetical protein
MSHQLPCVEWAEKLTLRPQDLSFLERTELERHLRTCSACSAVQAEYHSLDIQLRALPLPTIKPLPRLALPKDEDAISDS